MSGLFGIVSTDVDIRAYLDSAATRLSHLAHYTHYTWIATDAPIGLGHSGIGIFNREEQPIFSADQRLVLFLSGELYAKAALVTRLEAAGIAPRNQTDAELVLCAYQAFGDDFANTLEGAFFVALYDKPRQILLLANDRFGLYPHYIYWQDGKLAFGPEVKSVVCAPFVPRTLDVTAAAQYLRFQQLLGERTFHQDIKLFPYGSVAHVDLRAKTWTVKRYWDFDKLPQERKLSFDEAVVEGSRIFRGAVERLSAGDLRPGVFLTGGLDSRSLIGLMPPRTPPPVSATFGAKDSRDVYYAGQIARTVGSNHQWFDFPNGRWVLDSLDLHFNLTEGFHSWLHMHGVSMLPKLRGMMDYNLTGWDGGTVMGHSDHIRQMYNHPINESALAVEMFKQFNQAYTWPGLTEAEARLLYTPTFGKQAGGLAVDSLREEFHRFWDLRRQYAAEHFYVVNHCWRFTGHMVTTARSHIEVRFPFWDYQLIDFQYSLKPELRADQMLYRGIITREMPELARIPYDKKEFLPTVNRWEHNLQALSVRARRKLGRYPQRPTLYADYENYLRTDLRNWAESILYDPRTEARGMVNMDMVRALMERHLSGREEWMIGKIAPLITLEMVMRAFFD